VKKYFVQNERGAILPLLIVVLLVAGILVTTGLVKVPQIFKPKASLDIPIAPRDFVANCNVDNKSVVLKWSPVDSASSYKIRINNLKHTWDPNKCAAKATKDGSDVCVDNLPTHAGEQYSFNLSTGDLYDAWVHATNETGDSVPTHLTFRCPTPQSTPAPTATPNPDGKPAFNSASISFHTGDNVIEIRGTNFGKEIGYVYYSRGGSHEIKMHDRIYWGDTFLRIPRVISDPTAPVPNILALEQYIKVCQFNQTKCSEYIQMPKEARFASE
jgi:hypothetical protein